MARNASGFGGRAGPTGLQYNPMDAYGARTKTQPINVPLTSRVLDLRGLTSIPVGKMVPVQAFGLLREDKVETTNVRFNFEMLETVEILINPVHVRVMAWLVPNLAFERFQGSLDQLNRSYAKVAQIDGGSVVPFIETMSMNHSANKILTYLGKHAREGQQISSAYVEAYNKIFNQRCINRSPDLESQWRSKSATSLAPAFWVHSRFNDIVPDFDQASIEGEVPLTVVDSMMPVTGLGFRTTTTPAAGAWARRETGGIVSPSQQGYKSDPVAAPAAGSANFIVKEDPAHLGFPAIYAELKEQGITVSLANIELARKTQAFALLRRQYNGFDDDWIIDMLMNGLSVPEQSWGQPMLLADRATIFGMNKRYSTTADDLTASVVNGGTFIDLKFRTPRCPVGGVVMITVEVTPEQLFERQQDVYLHTKDQALYPEFLRDTLDPEKVDTVPNEYVDIDHDTPTGLFGYMPMNAKWSRTGPNIGGKFYRPEVDAAFDEDRQRIWAVETQNPTLSKDFYLCTTMHQKPFVVTDQDNFEAVSRGIVNITGHTVFGRLLIEASDDYDQVMEEAPIDTIPKSAQFSAEDTPSIDPVGAE